MNPTITAVTGLEVGHYTDLKHGTGCTVVLCRQGATGGVDTRGGSTGTRETDLLRPMHNTSPLHAVVLSGGSAFGLDTASGVVRYLAENHIGVRVGTATIPIVAAAILFDLGLKSSSVYPGPEQGYAACRAAGTLPTEEGSVGAGTGATVGKALGMDKAVKGGIGSSSLQLPGGAVVAAIAAVNPYGSVVDYQSGRLVAGPQREGTPRFHDTIELLIRNEAKNENQLMGNTTIGVIATNSFLTCEQANLMAQLSQDGLALAIRPCHTMRDGDTMFAMSTGHHKEPADMTALGAAAVEVTAQAVLRAVRSAEGLGGIPAINELHHN